ncbi:asparaginase [Helicobacter pametensis]|uniref:asparaginase n=1 Tax=Helicobacter pametensis TaxID=95149 RepID=UPI0004B71109|nr:asparaginase [Helicobacter pametensis]
MHRIKTMQNKKILILTTGGTIAGSGEDHLQGANYKAGSISGETLLSSLPPIPASLEVYEVAQIDSIEMDAKIWHKLLTLLHQNITLYDGFVITHGTDTMEESAFVLELLYQESKPVILVGAMRPSDAIGSDGIKNLCNAISLASNSKAKGVMVLMNDKIYDPKTIYKAHTYNLDAFASRNGGDMGYVLDGSVRFFYPPYKHTLPFVTDDLISLPKVEILYIYAGISDLPKFSHEVRGLIVAGCGAGNIPTKIRIQLRELQAQGIQIVACSRGNQGFVCESEFIPAYALSLPKARILLALCLQHKQAQEDIKAVFAHF